MKNLKRATLEGATELPFFEACNLHQKQIWSIEALKARALPFVLAGGAGYGGKSYLLRCAAVYLALYAKKLGLPKAPILFASSSYEALRDRHFHYFQEEWGAWGSLRTNDKTYGRSFVFHDPELSPIVFRNLADPNERKGSEFWAALVDELTEITQDVMGALLYMVRNPLHDWRPTLAASNPDGVGHMWVKTLFRPDHVPEYGTYDTLEALLSHPLRNEPFDSGTAPGFENLDPADYIYVPFLPDDNPTFDEATFWRMVSLLPPHVQQARRWGRWDAPEGARFGYLNAETHVFSPAHLWPSGIPEHYKVIMGGDYGMRAPYCALWFAVSEDKDLYLFKEDYKVNLSADEQAMRIVAGTPESVTVDKIGLDPAFWQTIRDVNGVDQARHVDIYQQVFDDYGGGRFPTPSKGFNKSRVMAMAGLDRLLKRDNGFPDLYIGSNCTNTWRELTGAVYDQRTGLAKLSEDLDPSCPDHAITALIYGTYNDYAAPQVHKAPADEVAERNRAFAQKREEMAMNVDESELMSSPW